METTVNRWEAACWPSCRMHTISPHWNVLLCANLTRPATSLFGLLSFKHFLTVFVDPVMTRTSV